MMKKKSAKYLTVLAMLITISLMLSYVETFIPIILIPGAKIGLPNVVTLIALMTLGFWEALAITLVRTTISALLFSSMISLIYSITGGILSLIVMYTLYRIFSDKISLQAISITGAITHNLGQLAVAMILLSTPGLAAYLPWLIVIAIPAGIVVGVAAKYLMKYFKSTLAIKVDE
ncbi:MAG: Gx transporter family protein [Eubacteriales bacterium]